MPDFPTSPSTVADWQAAALAGAHHRPLLEQARARCAALPASTWIHPVDDEAFAAQLQALDALAAAQPDRDALLRQHPLFGVPFAVKDNIDIAGAPTTAACPAWARVADHTATAVAKLMQAGAVWLGKTNLDQFATGLVGTRSPYGQPASVFNGDHISGGSSSGSAVAVASGGVAFALGTDTAGSGRVPAGFNQLVGLKPTPGRVSTRGVLPACRTLDCVSVFALTVRDAEQVLAVMEGPDAGDAFSQFQPGPAAWPAPSLRLGVPREVVLGDAYRGPWAQALAQAQALGHMLVPLDFSALHAVAELLYTGPWVAERHAVVQGLMESAPEALDPVVQQVIAVALRHSATDAFRGLYALKALEPQARALWHQVDALLVPTAPDHPSFAEVAADPVGRNSRLGTYTNFVNLLGWSALAVPAGTTERGLPFGVTFIAPGGHDVALADVGHRWQLAVNLPMGGLARRPADQPVPPTPRCAAATEPTLALAVVGAHLSGMPLNGQLVERRARLLEATDTSARYRLHALPGTVPPKPGLVRCADGEPGHAIALEVWAMPMSAVGSFLAMIPPPLGLGSVELSDGRWVHGFLCESQAVAQARDVSHLGGWRAFVREMAAARSA